MKNFLKIILVWFLLAVPMAGFIMAQATKKIEVNLLLFFIILFVYIIGSGIVSKSITDTYIYKKHQSSKDERKNLNLDLPVTLIFFILAMISFIFMIYLMVEIIRGDSRYHTLVGELFFGIIFWAYVYKAYVDKSFLVKFER